MSPMTVHPDHSGITVLYEKSVHKVTLANLLGTEGNDAGVQGWPRLAEFVRGLGLHSL